RPRRVDRPPYRGTDLDDARSGAHRYILAEEPARVGLDAIHGSHADTSNGCLVRSSFPVPGSSVGLPWAIQSRPNRLVVWASFVIFPVALVLALFWARHNARRW